jgi:hypothetical protein
MFEIHGFLTNVFINRHLKNNKKVLTHDQRNAIIPFAFERRILVKIYLGVAQFGSALPWGGRGRWFKSSHSDQYRTVISNENNRPVFLSNIV